MIKKLSALAILSMASTYALAGGTTTPVATDTNTCNSSPNHHCGLYIEFNAGTNIAYENINETISKFNFAYNDTQVGGYGLNGNFGYLFTPYFALDFGYTSYTPSTNWLPSINSVHAALKGVLPFADRFNISAKLGGMGVFAQSGGVGVGVFSLYMGASLGYAITDQLEFHLSIQGGVIPKWTNHAAIALLGAGLTYHFKTCG